MPVCNTKQTYGSLAKFFHWLTAFLFLLAYASIYYREWFAQSDLEYWLSVQLHFSVGFSVLGLVVLRLFWRFFNPSPLRENVSRLQEKAVKTVHTLLYVIMFAMPISGYLSLANYLSYGGGLVQFWFIYDLTFLENIEPLNFIGFNLSQVEDSASQVHFLLGRFVVGTLLFGHVSAALYHHYIHRDNTLTKMK